MEFGQRCQIMEFDIADPPTNYGIFLNEGFPNVI